MIYVAAIIRKERLDLANSNECAIRFRADEPYTALSSSVLAKSHGVRDCVGVAFQ
jgi:hypothetical protein